ncbi:SCO family protein [Sphingomicrobium flavum]|uniref:SCO family protein n=1 Tax=Sphingomicrobium flavum TaxID=1229164 RepID=UPI0021AE2F0A|nr:SCO family protein [Sphingomicrobium flavum]
MKLAKIRIALWVVVVLALAVYAFMQLRPATLAPQGEPMDLRSSIGGPFTLVGADGEPFSSMQLDGRPHAIFFGFTHCPDVCPATLAKLVNYRKAIGEDAFDIVFISVDPKRDGPEEVGQYSDTFETPVIGLTGSQAQIDKVKDLFGIESREMDDGFGGYTVNHTSTVFLMDGEGNFISSLSPEEGRQPSIAKLRRIAG